MTKIEWADMTINPVVGCSHCSPGCDNCYAEKFAARLANHPNPKISGKYAGVVDGKGKWTGKINLHMDGCLHAATVTRTPKRFFIGSMTDIFHENIPDEEIRMLFLTMTIVENDFSTYMVLTKRPHRAKAVLGDILTCPELHRVWLGVTVCNQEEAEQKIPLLLDTPAAVRFVSVEPMLGPMDLKHYLSMQERLLHWVICGGETGPGARPMHPDWVRSLRDQCQSAGTPFFFKGWGEWQPGALEKAVTEAKNCNTAWPDGTIGDGNSSERGGKGTNLYRVGKRRAGRLLDGVEYSEIPA